MGEQGRCVAVAMSGGVDSSVAAALLVDAGYQVFGVMMRLWSECNANDTSNRCCTPQAVQDARRVAGILGIPFYLVNYESQFKAAVVDTFVDEYARGRTPNPCLACNRHIRFGLLLQHAQAMGADYLATGHYARIVPGERYRLLKGVDARKDQSYVLHVLNQSQLARLLFPLGEMTKTHVRELARQRNLPVAEKAESQDLCFVSTGGYQDFLSRHMRVPAGPGPIYDQAGNVIGQHRGLIYYTVGQRHGLGLSSRVPLFVTAIEAEKNALRVGPVSALLRSSFTVGAVNYVSGVVPPTPFVCRVRLRYKAPEYEATVTPLPGARASVVLTEPQRPVSPGQAAVFYDGDDVLGGGIIE